MILIVRKAFLRKICVFLILPLLIVLAPIQPHASVETVATIGNSPSSRIVAIDAGHGGEDGGALAADGTEEKHLNLEIALRLRDLMQFSGQGAMMTRTDDISLDSGEPTVRARKRADLIRRTHIIEQGRADILISIHQNSLPSSPVTHGAQVFYNSSDTANDLAMWIQQALNQTANQGNEKHIRRTPKMYLMDHISAPGILVECGFLSNSEDIQLLKSASYQMKLSAAITSGYLQGLRASV